MKLINSIFDQQVEAMFTLSGVQVRGVQVERCAGGVCRWSVQVECAGGEVCRWRGVQVERCVDGEVCRWRGVQVERCAGGEVCRWRGVQVLLPNGQVLSSLLVIGLGDNCNRIYNPMNGFTM